MMTALSQICVSKRCYVIPLQLIEDTSGMPLIISAVQIILAVHNLHFRFLDEFVSTAGIRAFTGIFFFVAPAEKLDVMLLINCAAMALYSGLYA